MKIQEIQEIFKIERRQSETLCSQNSIFYT